MNNNSKLKSLTHKLVELKNSTDHMKGFLFRDNSGDYFIKPIEVYKGTAKEAGKFYLREEHVEFTNFCESPKLMKLEISVTPTREFKVDGKNVDEEVQKDREKYPILNRTLVQ